MRILVIGGGGREHSLCWAISASPLCESLYCAPGNAGIKNIAECVPISAEDTDNLLLFAIKKQIDFVVVGPEAALVKGIVDQLTSHGIKAFGPSAAAAMLEGSKGFMKNICKLNNIATAKYCKFTDHNLAKNYIKKHGAPIVVKADGLASGKGVTVAHSIDEALQAVDTMMTDDAFGLAGQALIIEEFLTGEELSFFALVDGQTALPLVAAQDHKAVGEGDIGPNTGGMGAYSPAPVLTKDLETEIMDSIIYPTVSGMAKEGIPFKGILYAGLILTEEGPKLLEYNVRFGDPECQVLMLRLRSDILPALIASYDGVLDKFNLRWSNNAAVTVVMAANGYPGNYKTGSEVRGLENIDSNEVIIFHAGTKTENNKLLANGGRVLNVCASGDTILEAKVKVYAAIDKIDWPQGFYRRDIGWRVIESDS
tara:strand:+ start:250 stop:1524 length:1275 start_codon:yes stop_codon:yes gene_type:complete